MSIRSGPTCMMWELECKLVEELGLHECDDDHGSPYDDRPGTYVTQRTASIKQCNEIAARYDNECVKPMKILWKFHIHIF